MNLERLMTSSTEIDLVAELQSRLKLFEVDAHGILGKHETAVQSRLISVDATRRQLVALSISQEELLDEELECVGAGLFRSAHVSAWYAFMDYLQEKLCSDGLAKVRAQYPAWKSHTTIEDLRENVPDYQLIEASRKVGLISKAEMKSLHGHLSTRNQCAHPSSYRPGINQTLGYVTDIIDAIQRLHPKTL